MVFFPLNPEEILNRISLKPDMLAADFGSGSGFFTFPLAEKLSQGLVYAIDVQQPTLSALKSAAFSKKINNIQLIHSDLERPKGSKLKDYYLDLVLLINTLSQAEDKDAIIKESARVLKEGGKLLVVDSFNFKKLVEESGFKAKKNLSLKNHFAVIFEKNNLKDLDFKFS